MNLTDNYRKTKDFILEYYWIAGIPLLIWGFLLVTNEKDDINTNQTETYGIVYGSSPIYKKYSKRNYRYEFYFNGKKYNGTSSAYTSKNIQKGNYYKVEFSDVNPEHNRMIFDIEYLKKIEKDENGTDTIYIRKDQILRNEFKERIDKLKIEIDSVKH